MDTQGRIRARKHRTHWTGVIIPHGAPQDWFIETFPDEEALNQYAAQYNLTVEIIEDDGEDDNSPERK